MVKLHVTSLDMTFNFGSTDAVLWSIKVLYRPTLVPIPHPSINTRYLYWKSVPKHAYCIWYDTSTGASCTTKYVLATV